MHGELESAEKRVGPLRRQTDLPREEILERLIDTFRDRVGGNLTEDDLTEEEISTAEELVRTKYGTEEWLRSIP